MQTSINRRPRTTKSSTETDALVDHSRYCSAGVKAYWKRRIRRRERRAGRAETRERGDD